MSFAAEWRPRAAASMCRLLNGALLFLFSDFVAQRMEQGSTSVGGLSPCCTWCLMMGGCQTKRLGCMWKDGCGGCLGGSLSSLGRNSFITAF